MKYLVSLFLSILMAFSLLTFTSCKKKEAPAPTEAPAPAAPSNAPGATNAPGK
ncbi:MAG: hypothetical protein M0Z59_01870 [Nitrospiraceae bacterium]|nr:hypothetical protein [Nitrospiraceae bacterium]